jgi:phosphocarrier protein HPr
VNGKSIMGVITLGATYNSQLKVIADGPDELAALDALEHLFENRFEED